VYPNWRSWPTEALFGYIDLRSVIGIADEEGFPHHRHAVDTLVSYR